MPVCVKKNNHSDDIIRLIVNSVASEASGSDMQLFSNTSHVAESGEVQEGNAYGVSRVSYREAENRTNSAEVHVGQKLYQLNCIKKYQKKSNSSLKVHLRIHTENIYLHNMWEGF